MTYHTNSSLTVATGVLDCKVLYCKLLNRTYLVSCLSFDKMSIYCIMQEVGIRALVYMI